jgi:hypothetical protein
MKKILVLVMDWTTTLKGTPLGESLFYIINENRNGVFITPFKNTEVDDLVKKITGKLPINWYALRNIGNGMISRQRFDDRVARMCNRVDELHVFIDMEKCSKPMIWKMIRVANVYEKEKTGMKARMHVLSNGMCIETTVDRVEEEMVE